MPRVDIIFDRYPNPPVIIGQVLLEDDETITGCLDSALNENPDAEAAAQTAIDHILHSGQAAVVLIALVPMKPANKTEEPS